MKFSHRITVCLFSFMLLCSSSTMRTFDEESLSQMLQELQANTPEKLSDELQKKVYDFINRIICAHTDLASLVQEDAIKTQDKDTKTALLQEIIETQKVISQLSKDFINSPTKPQLHKLLPILETIIQHLNNALKTDITKFKAIKLEEELKHFRVDPELIKRSKPVVKDEIQEEINEQDLIDRFQELETTFKDIQKKSENAGLYWYNHLYRNTFDRFVVAPCDKYNLHWKALYTSAALAGGSYLWYKLNTSTNGLPGKLKGNDEDPVYSYTPDSYALKDIAGRIHDTINYHVRNVLGWKPLPEYVSREIQQKIGNEKGIEHFQDAFAISTQEQVQEAIAKGIQKINSVPKQRPVNFFGTLENETYSAISGHWYLGATLLWQPFRDALIEKVTNLKDSANNKLLKFHNWLKGGAYYQRYKYKKNSFRIEPRFTFDDLIGLDHAKQVLGDIVKYIHDPESYDRAGLTPAMGYLMFGPTRTGKSMIAEALAGEIQKIKGTSDDFPFFVIEARYIAAEGNFQMIMNIIKNYSPCIIFIDEIDMLPLHRDKNNGKNTVLQEFLSTISGCMNGNNPDKQVIIIAATNRPDKLDPSLRSRLSVHIPFEYPSFIHRAEHLIREIEGKGLPVEQFDIRALAEQTEGCSFQQLHQVINNAQFITREQGRPITQADIEKSLNTEARNIIYHDYVDLSDEDQNTLAIHMAGHALAYTLIESKAAQLSQVTIRPVKTKIEDDSIWAECFKDKEMPNIQYGQIFTHYSGDSLKFTSKNELKRLCMIELAGRVAEDIVLGTSQTTKDTCSCHDATKAFYWARKYHLNGLDEKLLEHSKSMQDKLIDQAYAFMQECEDEMRILLEERKDLIQLVADSLKGLQVLSAENMQELVQLHKMMDGKPIDEFFKELLEQQSKESEDVDKKDISEDENSSAADQ
ncbi:MAG: AAA family ATPase [Candidatus Dependentiae bacterium]